MTGKCQCIIEETQLEQDRCILHDLYIDSADDLQYLFPAGRHQAEDHTQHQCQQNGENCCLHSIQKS